MSSFVETALDHVTTAFHQLQGITFVETLTLSIAGLALIFSGLTFWRQHVIRNNLKIRVVPPSITEAPTGLHSENYTSLRLNISVFNLGNRPVVIEGSSIWCAFGPPDKFEAFLEDENIKHLEGSIGIKAYLDPNHPGTSSQTGIIGAQSILSWGMVIMAPRQIPQHRDGQSLLCIALIFSDSRGKSVRLEIPVAIHQYTTVQDGTGILHLDVERFRNDNHLIKVF